MSLEVKIFRWAFLKLGTGVKVDPYVLFFSDFWDTSAHAIK